MSINAFSKDFSDQVASCGNPFVRQPVIHSGPFSSGQNDRLVSENSKVVRDVALWQGETVHDLSN